MEVQHQCRWVLCDHGGSNDAQERGEDHWDGGNTAQGLLVASVDMMHELTFNKNIHCKYKISWWYPCGLTLFWCNWLHCFFDSITSSLFPLALHQLRLLLTWTVACIFYYRQIVWIMASIHTLPLRTKRQRMPHRVWAAWMWTSLKWTHLRKWWGKRTASLCVFNCHPS